MKANKKRYAWRQVMREGKNWQCMLAGVLSMGAVVLATFLSAGAAENNGTRQKGHKDCSSCHNSNDPVNDAFLFINNAEPSQLCLGCHNYLNSHHPVNFEPDRILFDEGDINPFPLFDGQIRCLTCHEVHPEEKVRKLLRGGPYADRRGICFKCHLDESANPFNIHKMLDAGGRIIELNGAPVCLTCHREMPKQSEFRNQASFRADVGFICWRCHPPMPGNFFNDHFQVRPSAKVRDLMKKNEIENNIGFPLKNRGRITCSTCHNPHQKGVIRFGSAIAGEDEHDKLRMPPGVICSGCHEK